MNYSTFFPSHSPSMRLSKQIKKGTLSFHIYYEENPKKLDNCIIYWSQHSTGLLFLLRAQIIRSFGFTYTAIWRGNAKCQFNVNLFLEHQRNFSSFSFFVHAFRHYYSDVWKRNMAGKKWWKKNIRRKERWFCGIDVCFKFKYFPSGMFLESSLVFIVCRGLTTHFKIDFTRSFQFFFSWNCNLQYMQMHTDNL